MIHVTLFGFCSGCTGGSGRGQLFENGLGGGGGHGGNGGDGYYNGTFVQGGATYGDADLPCELGSGSGNDSLAGATAGGGIIGKLYMWLKKNNSLWYTMTLCNISLLFIYLSGSLIEAYAITSLSVCHVL